MTTPQFAPGFRLSALDVVVLFAAAVCSLSLDAIHGAGLVIGFVVGHFFLFCNVVRVSRSLELIWSLIFVLLAAGAILIETPSWFATFGISLAVTVLVVLIEIRKPSYHGIGWKFINPRLPQWWANHQGNRVSGSAR